jgi:hypothetical protein
VDEAGVANAYPGRSDVTIDDTIAADITATRPVLLLIWFEILLFMQDYQTNLSIKRR